MRGVLRPTTACRWCNNCWARSHRSDQTNLDQTQSTNLVQCLEARSRVQMVQRLLGEVEAASAAMLAGLLARLKGPIQLPECLRVVGCLRRLAAFPEPELRRRCDASALPPRNVPYIKLQSCMLYDPVYHPVPAYHLMKVVADPLGHMALFSSGMATG